MDIIVRGGKGIADPHELLALQPGQQYWVWRGQKPTRAQPGDKVYFVDRGGIYLSATYAGYDHRSSQNLQGESQSGPAILLTTPIEHIDPPFQLDPAILLGQWRWRYDYWDLRQSICRS